MPVTIEGWVRGALVLSLILGLAQVLWAADPQALHEPFEDQVAFQPVNAIDHAVLAALRDRHIQPAARCSDEMFLRRACLDVIGALPRPAEVTAFINDKSPDKRNQLIDKLLARPEYADYWSMKWCDVLRVKSEHPINLWPNAVQAYHHWIRAALASNMPYDQFARELLTASGSNFRVPQVNFYRAIQGRSPATIASAVALTWMGQRMERWPPSQRDEFEKFFTKLAYKGTAEWKEEIVHINPAPWDGFDARLPDGRKVSVQAGDDPRLAVADWLIQPDNPHFKRAIVNRLWWWTMGRGIVQEPDDIRPDNPASNPQLLAVLEQSLVDARWDVKQVLRLILQSRTYQQSPIARSSSPEAGALFAYYHIRQLEAEVLADVLVDLLGRPELYQSPIPEPFTFVPEYHHTVRLNDGSITSAFLQLFGRSARDSGYACERITTPTDAQRLHLLNSSMLQDRLERSWQFGQLLKSHSGDKDRLIRGVYLTFLSRRPTPAEQATARNYFGTDDTQLKDGAADLAWALLNSKEFLFKH